MSIVTRLVYVESAGNEQLEESFAWYDGKVLTAAQHAEREQLHRELADIVEKADSDETAEWGRAARSGERLLVEIGATPASGATRRLTATVVVSADRPATEWADGTAEEIAAILRDGEVSISSDQLARAFVKGWSRKSPFAGRDLTRALVAVGTAAAIAWLWIRRAGRLRRRTTAPGEPE
jgi:hypothetical protein